MTTKELIEELKKADPEGNMHVRLCSSGEGYDVPYFCATKAGYWDGPYEYIDENGKFVTSTKGDKVDIQVCSLSDFIYRCLDNGENIEDQIRVEYDYMEGYREKGFWKEVYRLKAEWEDITRESLQRCAIELLTRYKKGLRIFQTQEGRPNWQWTYLVEKNDKDEGYILSKQANGCVCDALMDSGFFKLVQIEDNKWEWIVII